MEALDLGEENVKVRLRRARALLGRELYARSGTAAAQLSRSWEGAAIAW